MLRIKIFVADRSAIILSTLFVMQMQGIYSVALERRRKI